MLRKPNREHITLALTEHTSKRATAMLALRALTVIAQEPIAHCILTAQSYVLPSRAHQRTPMATITYVGITDTGFEHTVIQHLCGGGIHAKAAGLLLLDSEKST